MRSKSGFGTNRDSIVDTRQTRRPASSGIQIEVIAQKTLHRRQALNFFWRRSQGLLRIIRTTPRLSLHVHDTACNNMAIRTTTRYFFLALGVFAAAAIAAPVQDGQPGRVYDRAPAVATDLAPAACVTGSPASGAYDIKYATVAAPATTSRSYDIDTSFSSAHAVGSAMVSPPLRRPNGRTGQQAPCFPILCPRALSLSVPVLIVAVECSPDAALQP